MSNDTKSKDLLNRVSSDVAQLKHDIASLFSHTGKHALPDTARGIADYGRDRFHAGGDYAASSLKYMRQHPGQSSVGILGGLFLLGVAGAGIYYLCKSDCCGETCEEIDSTDPHHPANQDLPPYIS